MPTISIAARCGSFVSSRRGAHTLRNEVIELASSGATPVILDFGDVVSISDSFSDELLGVLAAERGLPWVLENVRILNLAADDRRDVERVVERRAGGVSVAPAFG